MALFALLVEDYPKGYPRLSALMSAHESFQIFRRFSILRTRILLLSQTRIASLERRLDTIDRAEKSPLFLASSRMDKNDERWATIAEIREELVKYGEFNRVHETCKDSDRN